MSRLVLGIAALAAAVDVLAQQAPVFRARREIVRVDVLVTARGAPVRGLGVDDFDIKDNGVLQHVDLVLADTAPINVILGLDMSGSVAGNRLDQLRQAGRTLLSGLHTGDRAALLTFSHDVRLRSFLTPDLEAVKRALGAVRTAGGGTSLADATAMALTLADTDAGRSLVIMFSDGLDTSSFLTFADVHDTAQRIGMVVYPVSVASVRQPFLRDLAAETGGTLTEIASTKNLEEAFGRILTEFRDRYLLSYSPVGVSREGRHRLEVRVKGHGGLSVMARPGYVSGP